MLKKIKLDIHSHIENLDLHGLPDGEPEISDSSHSGAMKISGDEFSLSYRESSEGGSVFCDILIADGAVTVRRSGAIVSVLYFNENEEYKTVYELPPYKFDMTVSTKRIRNSLSEAGGSLDIHYGMNVGGAAKKVRMKIDVSEVKI